MKHDWISDGTDGGTSRCRNCGLIWEFGDERANEPCPIKSKDCEMTDVEKLIDKYEEYLAALLEELNETTGIAYIHGWRSSRVEEGNRLREELGVLKDKLGIKS
jgi:hypothetical protein